MVAAMGITGFAGGIYAHFHTGRSLSGMIRTGLAGAVLSFNFAVLTTLGYVLFMGLSADKMVPSFLTGIGFYLTHILSNFIIFLIIVPILIDAVETNHLIHGISLQTGKK